MPTTRSPTCWASSPDRRRADDRDRCPLLDAHRCGHALGAFTVYDIEFTLAVLQAAQAVDVPVLIRAGSSGFDYAGEEVLGRVAKTMAEQAPVRVGVHLDHSRSLEEVRRCLDRGDTSVMVDGSHLPFAENAAIASRAVAVAGPYGAWVEAELGVIAGDEDRTMPVSAAPGTDPQQAGRFVEESGVDALAVAIGNVHGMTTRPVTLDSDRLREIHDHTRALTAYERTDDDLAAFTGAGVAAATAVVTDRLQFFSFTVNHNESGPS